MEILILHQSVQVRVGCVQQEYILKEGLAEFLLEGDDLTDLPCRTVRNPGKPYADRFYEGEILFVAAKARYGGAAGFIKEMNTHARCYRANPLDPPPIRCVGGVCACACLLNTVC